MDDSGIEDDLIFAINKHHVQQHRPSLSGASSANSVTSSAHSAPSNLLSKPYILCDGGDSISDGDVNSTDAPSLDGSIYGQPDALGQGDGEYNHTPTAGTTQEQLSQYLADAYIGYSTGPSGGQRGHYSGSPSTHQQDSEKIRQLQHQILEIKSRTAQEMSKLQRVYSVRIAEDSKKLQMTCIRLRATGKERDEALREVAKLQELCKRAYEQLQSKENLIKQWRTKITEDENQLEGLNMQIEEYRVALEDAQQRISTSRTTAKKPNRACFCSELQALAPELPQATILRYLRTSLGLANSPSVTEDVEETEEVPCTEMVEKTNESATPLSVDVSNQSAEIPSICVPETSQRDPSDSTANQSKPKMTAATLEPIVIIKQDESVAIGEVASCCILPSALTTAIQNVEKSQVYKEDVDLGRREEAAAGDVPAALGLRVEVLTAQTATEQPPKKRVAPGRRRQKRPLSANVLSTPIAQVTPAAQTTPANQSTSAGQTTPVDQPAVLEKHLTGKTCSSAEETMARPGEMEHMSTGEVAAAPVTPVGSAADEVAKIAETRRQRALRQGVIKPRPIEELLKTGLHNNNKRRRATSSRPSLSQPSMNMPSREDGELW